MAQANLLGPANLGRLVLLFFAVVLGIGVVSALLPGVLRDIVQTLAGAIAGFYAARDVGERHMRRGGAAPGRRSRLGFSFIAALIVFAVLAGLLAAVLPGSGADSGDLAVNVAIGFPVVFAAAVAAIHVGLGAGVKRAKNIA